MIRAGISKVSMVLSRFKAISHDHFKIWANYGFKGAVYGYDGLVCGLKTDHG
jgi:hypothetical protein